MSHPGANRVRKEINHIQTDEAVRSSGIRLEQIGDSLVKLTGYVNGPPDTPYENGVYQLDIDIPDMYPFHPPKVKFATKIWHPNVSSVTGAICLDILKDQWYGPHKAAAMTLKTVLLSIQILMANPEPSSPQDAEVANQYTSNYDLWEKTAQYWTDLYAKGGSDSGPDAAKIKQLMEMGFDKEKSTWALAKTAGNVEAAIEKLFSM